MLTVLLYGNSLAVSTIGANLQACPDLQVLSLDPCAPDPIHCLEQLQPASIIFDRTTVRPDFAFKLWKTQPHLLLIGVDPSSDEILVLSSHLQQALNVSSLVDIICKKGNCHA